MLRRETHLEQYHTTLQPLHLLRVTGYFSDDITPQAQQLDSLALAYSSFNDILGAGLPAYASVSGIGELEGKNVHRHRGSQSASAQ